MSNTLSRARELDLVILEDVLFLREEDYPEWFGNIKFHLSHQSNLLRKDWDHYIKYFGENIQDTTLPYEWNKEHWK